MCPTRKRLSKSTALRSDVQRVATASERPALGVSRTTGSRRSSLSAGELTRRDISRKCSRPLLSQTLRGSRQAPKAESPSRNRTDGPSSRSAAAASAPGSDHELPEVSGARERLVRGTESPTVYRHDPKPWEPRRTSRQTAGPPPRQPRRPFRGPHAERHRPTSSSRQFEANASDRSYYSPMTIHTSSKTR